MLAGIKRLDTERTLPPPHLLHIADDSLPAVRDIDVLVLDPGPLFAVSSMFPQRLDLRGKGARELVEA